MSGPQDHTELNPVEARQGVITGHMRYVLGISLFLAALLLLSIWLIFLR